MDAPHSNPPPHRWIEAYWQVGLLRPTGTRHRRTARRTRPAHGPLDSLRTTPRHTSSRADRPSQLVGNRGSVRRQYRCAGPLSSISQALQISALAHQLANTLTSDFDPQQVCGPRGGPPRRAVEPRTADVKAKSRRESRNAARLSSHQVNENSQQPDRCGGDAATDKYIQVHATTPFLPLEHAVWPATEGIVQPHGQYRHLRGQRDSRKGETKAVTNLSKCSVNPH